MKSNLCNKPLASMSRNVILSMTDVLHLARQKLLLVLFTYFLAAEATVLFLRTSPVPNSSGDMDYLRPLAFAVLRGKRNVDCD